LNTYLTIVYIYYTVNLLMTIYYTTGVIYIYIIVQLTTGRWLYCVECPQYSIRLEALAVCATVALSYNVFFKLNDLYISTFCTCNMKRCRYAVTARTVRKKRWKLLTRLLSSSLRC